MATEADGKTCPFCGEKIPAAVMKCPSCREVLEKAPSASGRPGADRETREEYLARINSVNLGHRAFAPKSFDADDWPPRTDWSGHPKRVAALAEVEERERERVPEQPPAQPRKGWRRLRAIDLSSQYQDLMAKSKNLGATLVTRHQQQAETSDQKAEQV